MEVLPGSWRRVLEGIAGGPAVAYRAATDPCRRRADAPGDVQRSPDAL
jgi:hypothetical protein